MRPLPRRKRKHRGTSLGLLALCLAAARCLQSFSRQHFALLCHPPLPQTGVPSWHLGRKVELTSHEACYVSILPSEKELGRIPGQSMSLYIPQSTINATAGEDILLSVDYSCHGVPTIEWKYTSNWGVQKIVQWKPGTQANVSQSHKDRVYTFDNGSIQLFSVGVRDSGYYVITVTEHLGSSQFGTIVLHVSEILYEDLHFVAVFLAFLAAVAAVLISLMWVCNKCAYKFQRKRRHKLKESTTEEIELQDVEC
ncbi:V-set and transmembrane domain-containing protein 5 isoform X2 [Pteropus medius]|uniref:V-set and transmembrane domain-containing protein 5 isoform X2 n=1 Tax=Pteropus vampyrus TaxID=132908 RepID=UPI00196A54DB|nr:V-set and transmembrane domain-containing protein 5 isoform X2 [Pteropus giganteus]